MNEKQQIGERERGVENWWENEGADGLFETKIKFTTDKEWKDVKSLLKTAWMNGAFVARENN